ncbi:1810_t:CDS:2, partial [Rhizophagus irregularis]
MRITRSANNNIFTHQGLVGMTSLLQHLRITQYAEFIVRINSQEWGGISTRIILRNAQLRAGLAGCILTIEPSKLLQVNIPNNFNFNILKDMKDQLFNFDAINVEDWHLDILDTTILDFLLQPNCNHNNIWLDHDLSERNRLKAFDNFIKRSNHYILLNSIKQFLGGQGQAILHLTPSPRYKPIIPQHPSLDRRSRRRKEWVIIICEGSDLLIKCAGCSTSSMNGQTSTETCIRRGHFSKAT